METIIYSPTKTKNLKSLLFITGSAVFTSTVILLYSYQLKSFVPSSNLVREYFICFGQLFFQASLLLFFKYKSQLIWDYLKQMMFVSLVGSVLLTPALVSAFLFFPFSPGAVYFLSYFFIIVLFMFFNHKKRVEKIHAPHWLTYTWVLYRLIVLAIIL